MKRSLLLLSLFSANFVFAADDSKWKQQEDAELARALQESLGSEENQLQKVLEDSARLTRRDKPRRAAVTPVHPEDQELQRALEQSQLEAAIAASLKENKPKSLKNVVKTGKKVLTYADKNKLYQIWKNKGLDHEMLDTLKIDRIIRDLNAQLELDLDETDRDLIEDFLSWIKHEAREKLEQRAKAVAQENKAKLLASLATKHKKKSKKTGAAAKQAQADSDSDSGYKSPESSSSASSDDESEEGLTPGEIKREPQKRRVIFQKFLKELREEQTSLLSADAMLNFVLDTKSIFNELEFLKSLDVNQDTPALNILMFILESCGIKKAAGYNKFEKALLAHLKKSKKEGREIIIESTGLFSLAGFKPELLLEDKVLTELLNNNEKLGELYYACLTQAPK